MFLTCILAIYVSCVIEKDTGWQILSPSFSSQGNRGSERSDKLLKATQRVGEAGFQRRLAAALLTTHPAHSWCPTVLHLPFPTQSLPLIFWSVLPPFLPSPWSRALSPTASTWQEAPHSPPSFFLCPPFNVLPTQQPERASFKHFIMKNTTCTKNEFYSGHLYVHP